MNLCTLRYIRPCLHKQACMHCISAQQNCLMVKCFTKYKVIRLLSFDQSVAMLRANGHANVLTVKIAASELKKKTVEMTS